MQQGSESLIYVNEKNESIEIGYSLPFFLQNVNGVDGLSNEIFKVKSYNQDGETSVGGTLNPRPISIVGVITGEHKQELMLYRQRLIKVFNPKLKGVLYYRTGDNTRFIDCVVEDAPRFANDNRSMYQDFIINLYCPNPFWKIERVRSDVAVWKPTFEYPLEILQNGIEMGVKEVSKVFNIANRGDIETGLTMEIKADGPITNPSVTKLATNETIKINKLISSGDILYINTGYGNTRVELKKPDGSIQNVFNWTDLTSVFFQLDAGDNILKYDADDGVDNIDFVVYHTPQFLGI